MAATSAQVRWFRLDPGAGEVAACREVLAPAELARVDRYATPVLRRRATVRLARRRQLLGAALGLEPAEVPLAAGPTGQPRVGGPHGLHVSAASSGDVGVVAWSATSEVGVDVESLDELGDAQALCRRVGSPAERAELDGLDGDELRLALLGVWTRKEAYLKATGEGLAVDLREVVVPVGELGSWTRLRPFRTGPCWWVCDLRAPAPGLRAAIVVADVGPGAAPPSLVVADV